MLSLRDDLLLLIASFGGYDVAWQLHHTNKLLYGVFWEWLNRCIIPVVVCRTTVDTNLMFVRFDALSQASRPVAFVADVALPIMPRRIAMGKAVIHEVRSADATKIARVIVERIAAEFQQQHHGRLFSWDVPFVAVVSDSAEVASAISVELCMNADCQRVARNSITLANFDQRVGVDTISQGIGVDFIELPAGNGGGSHSGGAAPATRSLPITMEDSIVHIGTFTRKTILKNLLAPRQCSTSSPRRGINSNLDTVLSGDRAACLVGRPSFLGYYSSPLNEDEKESPTSFRFVYANRRESIVDAFSSRGDDKTMIVIETPQALAELKLRASTWREPILCRGGTAGVTFPDIVTAVNRLPGIDRNPPLLVGRTRLNKDVRVRFADFTSQNRRQRSFIHKDFPSSTPEPLGGQWLYVADNTILDCCCEERFTVPSPVVKQSPWILRSPPQEALDSGLHVPMLLVGPCGTFSSEHEEPMGSAVWVHEYLGCKQWFFEVYGRPGTWRTFYQQKGETVLMPPHVRHVVKNSYSPPPGDASASSWDVVSLMDLHMNFAVATNVWIE